jgi:hypothetical protein
MASTGGTMFGPMGTTDRTLVKTTPQINEGYLAEVFTSPDVAPEVKIALAKYLTEKQAPVTTPTATKTVGAAGATGEKPPTAEPATTGWDKVTEKAAEIIPPVTQTIGETTSNITKDVATATADVTKNVTDTTTAWAGSFKIIAIAIVCIVLFIIVPITILIFIKKKKTNKNSSIESPAVELIKEELFEESTKK